LDLWTQRLTVSYRRSLKFYERRLEILRSFEEQGDLFDFRVTDDRVSVRLGGPQHRLGFGATRIDAAVLDPRADSQRVKDAIVSAGDALAPERMVRPIMRFQWLSPLENISYDEARVAAAQAVFREDALTDFALIVDGKIEQPSLEFQAECGIVDDDEIPSRLSGQRSQVIPGDDEAPPSLWPPESLPAVAAYGGVVCFLKDRPDSPKGLTDLWEATKGAMEQLMSNLMKSFMAADE
jgi:hypothetical protein